MGLLKFRDCPEAYQELLLVSPHPLSHAHPADCSVWRVVGDITGEESVARSRRLGRLDNIEYTYHDRTTEIIHRV